MYRILLWLVVMLVQFPAQALPLELRVGASLHKPVFFFDDNDEAQGIYVDLLREIAKQENLTLTFTADQPDALLEDLTENRLDLVVGLPLLREYDDWVLLNEEPLVVQWAQVFVAEPPLWSEWLAGLGLSPPAGKIRSLPDLQGKTLAIAEDSLHRPALENLCLRFGRRCTVQPVPHDKVLAQLTRNQAHAALVDAFDVVKAGHHPTAVVFDPVPLGFAASGYQGRELLAVLDAYLLQWKNRRDSPYAQTLMRWQESPTIQSAESAATASLYLTLAAIVLVAGLGWLAGAALERRRLQNKPDPELDRLRRTERIYHTMVESLPYGLQEIDIEGKILFSNMVEHQIRRYSHGELIGKSIVDMLAFDKQKAEMRKYLAYLAKEQPPLEPYYTTVVRKDGEYADLRMEWAYRRNELGQVTGLFGLVTDVTQTNQLKAKIVDNQRELQQSVAQRAADLKEAYQDLLTAATVFEHTDQVIVVMDTDGQIQSVNPAFLRTTDYDEEDVLGQPFTDFFTKPHARGLPDKLWDTLHSKSAWQGELWPQRKTAKPYPAWASLNAVLDAEEHTRQYVALLTDISALKRAEQQIWRQAHFDNLTGLPNRNLFYQRLNQAIDHAGAEKLRVAVMFIDLDHFKEVNDTLGHDAGDELLKQVSERLKKCLHQGDTVARMGGDEFTVIMPRLRQTETAEETARKILKVLGQPFALTAKTVHISGSVGIVIYPEGGKNMTTLLKNADIAMYQAKESGRDAYRLWAQDTPASI